MNDIRSQNKPDDPILGFGYVIIPNDVDREAYVEYVHKTGQCMIVTDYGAVTKDVAVPKNLIGYIEFPKNPNSDDPVGRLGSLISWMRIPHYNKVAITNIYHKANEMSFTGEYERVDELKKGNAIVTDAKVIDDIHVSKVSKVRTETSESVATQEIKTSGPEASASYKQTSEGDIIEHADNDKFASAMNEFNISIQDGQTILAFIQLIKDKKIVVESDQIEIGVNLLEPAVKGDTLVDVLSQLITAIRSLTANTSQGPTILPLINDAQFEAVSNVLDTIKSQKVSVE